MQCPYCKKGSKWVSNDVVYGRRYGKSYMMWWCEPCDARVGCHNNSKRPLGTLATRKLREARMETKKVFIDHFMGGDWRDKKGKNEGYKFLKKHFNRDYHFGESSLEELEIIKDLLEYERTHKSIQRT